MTGVVVLLVALVVAAAVGILRRASDGRLRVRRAAAAGTHQAADLRPLVPGTTGERATLLQFSSAFCAPCRATRRVLGEIAALVPGVEHVEVDAESHLELVRALGVLRTPTTLVLDAGGREVVRAAGQPRKADVLAALGAGSTLVTMQLVLVKRRAVDLCRLGSCLCPLS